MISCIIPMYNSETYIERAIMSVANQNYNDYQIIVVNDGSTDNSVKIVEKLRQENNNIILLSFPNGGVSKARNEGLRVAKGEFIVFLDSDDELAPGFFNYAMPLITNNADIVVGGDVSVRGDKQLDPHSFSNNYEIWNENKPIEQCLLSRKYTWNVGGKIFKKSILDGLFFIEGRITAEDSYFFFECCLRQPTIYYCDTYAQTVHLTSGSATRSPMTIKKIKDMLFFTSLKTKYITEQHLPFTELAFCNEVSVRLQILDGISISGCQDKALKNEIVEFVKQNKRFYILNEYKKLIKYVTHNMFWFYCCYRRFVCLIKKFFKK